jgi:hypothetical protein
VSNNGEKADLDLHEIDLDDPLLGPPDAIAEPVIDPLTEYLDFDRLTWENFERLLVRVAQDVLIGGWSCRRRTDGRARLLRRS